MLLTVTCPTPFRPFVSTKLYVAATRRSAFPAVIECSPRKTRPVNGSERLICVWEVELNGSCLKALNQRFKRLVW